MENKLWCFVSMALIAAGSVTTSYAKDDGKTPIQFIPVKDVQINDAFWTPKFNRWNSVTVPDVFNKFEGKHLKTAEEQNNNNIFMDFDEVAAGRKGTGHSAGLPWFNGLVYETIRGVSDLLMQHPDKKLEDRIDKYITRIEAAQKIDSNGFIDTYTDLVQPEYRWGENGGFLRWQHNVYNAGMLIEAGVHYYEATGKVKLLEVAVRLANYMCDLMGPAPKKNIIPSHSGPEEAVIKLYWLFKQNPDIKKQINLPVDETAYWKLVTFWMENRGKHCGYPLWVKWGNEKSEQWIREQKYKDPQFGDNARPSWGDYAQDSITIFEQKTIEGHAVRATLLATGVVAAALENHSPKYIQTATDWWDNMVGRRMFITGGVGAIHFDEKFGEDYFLPTDAYLETCAAVGAGFFSQRMNELTGEGKYMDEFERVLYNNVLTGISLSGDKYTYQNPLNSHNHSRWEWHSCPCCPPMFLKIVSAMPGFIYAKQADQLMVNLFVSSQATIELDHNTVHVQQETGYPWTGKINVTLQPEKRGKFSVKIRVPGWAQGVENPYGLYQSNLISQITLAINGKLEKVKVVDGYVEINRNWGKADRIELNLPMQPRIITACEQVKDLKGKIALASGPVVYCLEEIDNAGLDHLRIDTNCSMELVPEKGLLEGVNVIKGVAVDDKKQQINFTAIPYYAMGNRKQGAYEVWIPINKDELIEIDASKIENTIPAYLYGSCIEDVNHEIYGGIYNQRIFGESFEEPTPGITFDDFSIYDGNWTTSHGELHATKAAGSKFIYNPIELKNGVVEAEIKFDDTSGDNAGLITRVSKEAKGADAFNGYEISLAANGKKVVIGKHENNFSHIRDIEVDCNPAEWNRLKVVMNDGRMEIFLNDKSLFVHNENNPILATGRIGLRSWNSNVKFRNVRMKAENMDKILKFNTTPQPEVSFHWTPIQTGNVKAVFIHDNKDAYNSTWSQMISKNGGSGKVGVANMGLNGWGIAVKEGQKFEGRLYLKGSYKGVVKVALQSVDGNKEYAIQELKGVTDKWQKFPFEFISNVTDTNARLAVYIENNGKVWIDQVVLMGTGDDLFHNLPLRNDIAKTMVNQGLTFLRYGGTMVNAPDYKFKNMIGDRDKRPQYRGHWYPYSTNGFGIEEFLQLCEAAGFEPCFAVNVGESAQDMADMIEYLNGPVTSEWGKKRADAGHPKPYNVKYIEIGNEEVIWGDIRKDYEKYIQDFNRIYDAIKSKDPNIEFVSAAWWRPDSQENMKMVFDALNGKAAYWDYHPWADDNILGSQVEGELKQMKDYFQKWDPNTKMKCALFEENGVTHDMRRALGHVTIQNAARRMGDFLLTTCAANALEPYLQNDNGWNQGQIFFTPSQVWGMPPFYAKQMASNHHKPFRVFSATHGELDVTAATDEKKEEVVVHVSNIHDYVITADICLKGFDSPSKIKVITLSGDLKDKNTPEQPERIVPQEKVLYYTKDLKYEFPANSYTILVYQR